MSRKGWSCPGRLEGHLHGYNKSLPSKTLFLLQMCLCSANLQQKMKGQKLFQTPHVFVFPLSKNLSRISFFFKYCLQKLLVALTPLLSFSNSHFFPSFYTIATLFHRYQQLSLQIHIDFNTIHRNFLRCFSKSP